MIAYESHFIFHSVNKSVDEFGLVEEGAGVADNLLDMRLFLLCKLTGVELSFEQDYSKPVEQVYLLSVIFVVDSCAESFDQWAHYEMLDFSFQVREVFDRVKDELHELAC